MNGRLSVVGVMGSGTMEHAELAEPLGRALARMDVHLLTGGGGGVMAAVSRAFASVERRAGLVIGVLPGVAGRSGETPPGYPNPWLELEIRTHLDARGGRGEALALRNHVNVLSSDVVVALPGGAGTASEIALAMRYGRPLVLFGRDERVGDMQASEAGATAASALEDVVAFLRSSLPVRAEAAYIAPATCPQRKEGPS